MKSVFKRIIGAYKLFTPQETHSLELLFSNLFYKWNSSLDGALKQILMKKKHLEAGICEHDDLDVNMIFTKSPLSNIAIYSLHLDKENTWIWKLIKEVNLSP